MVNTHEALQRRYIRQAQEAVTLGPKGKWPGSGTCCFSDADDAPPAERRNLTRPRYKRGTW
jgi:hypothetical protein